MIFTGWYRIDRDSRAPSKVNLEEEYDMGPEIEGEGRSEAIRKWSHLDPNSSEIKDKPPQPGDVIIDPFDKAWIFTPSGIWAIVEIIDK